MKQKFLLFALMGIMAGLVVTACNKDKDAEDEQETSAETTPGVTTFARTGFNCPVGVAIDGTGNVYVADMYNNRIKKITPNGAVSTLAGGGSQDYADGTGTAAKFNWPCDLTVDATGNVYVADNYNYCIRKITPSGVVTTFAGSNVSGYADGTGTTAKFGCVIGISLDAAGNLYVADVGTTEGGTIVGIRKITPTGVVSTLAGSTSSGYADGTGTVAKFNSPEGIAVDAAGNVYVADRGNHCIRKITPNGVVSTFAGSAQQRGYVDAKGTAAKFYSPTAVAFDSKGDLYVSDHYNHRIRKITSDGDVTTYAGYGGEAGKYGGGGLVNGTRDSAMFNNPSGIAINASGYIYVAEGPNNCIRRIVP
jgi:sugar lactone lactonase YvrE